MAHPTRPHLLSLRDWWALGDDHGGHVELQEGVRVVAPRPSPAKLLAVIALGGLGAALLAWLLQSGA